MTLMGVLRATFFSRNHTRENVDAVQDVLLLLYLLDKAGNNVTGTDPLQAKIKLMKLVYLAEKAMTDVGYKGFNFFFNIYKHGPSSRELLKTLDDLAKKKLIHIDEKTSSIVLTDGGRSTIRDFVETAPEKNKEIFSVIDSTVDKYGNLPVKKILDLVYSMEVTPMHSSTKINIGKEVQDGLRTRLLMKLDSEQIKNELNVSEDWIETVNVIMNPAF